MEPDRGNIILYKSEDGQEAVNVRLAGETVWLTLNQMSEIFDRDKSVISRHMRNIFKTGELAKEAVVAKNATTASDGKTYPVEFFNLDAIISVGYRVNSKRGTQFRIWATSILKDHLARGYTLNQRRLAKKGIHEAQQILLLLANTLGNQNLVSDEGRSVLNIVNRYAKAWQLLLQYDEDKLPPPNTSQVAGELLDIVDVRGAINSFKHGLMAKMEAKDILITRHWLL